MPALQAYSRDLSYSYALGLFPASELMKKRPELARRLLVSSKAENSEGRLLVLGDDPLRLGTEGILTEPQNRSKYIGILAFFIDCRRADPTPLRAMKGRITTETSRHHTSLGSKALMLSSYVIMDMRGSAKMKMNIAAAIETMDVSLKQ